MMRQHGLNLQVVQTGPGPWCSSSSVPGPFHENDRPAMSIDWQGIDWDLWLSLIPQFLWCVYTAYKL